MTCDVGVRHRCPQAAFLVLGLIVGACRVPADHDSGWEQPSAVPEFTRGTGSALQTAVVRLRSARGGPVLILAGTWHVGSPAYYARVQGALEGADLVLSETVRPWRDSAVGQRAAPADLRLLWRYQRAVATLLGWRLQADWEFSIADERWQPLDLSWREQAAVLTDDSLLDDAQRAEVERLEGLARGEGTVEHREAAAQRLRASMGRRREATVPRGWERARNEAIFAGLREALERRSARRVVLLHGPAHLRAIAPRVEAELGYVAEGVRWLEVGQQ